MLNEAQPIFQVHLLSVIKAVEINATNQLPVSYHSELALSSPKERQAFIFNHLQRIKNIQIYKEMTIFKKLLKILIQGEDLHIVINVLNKKVKSCLWSKHQWFSKMRSFPRFRSTKLSGFSIHFQTSVVGKEKTITLD